MLVVHRKNNRHLSDLTNLARVVQDNLAASMVFSASTQFDIDHATALVGPDDLLAGTIAGMLKGCPRNPRA